MCSSDLSFDMSQARRYGVGQLARAGVQNFPRPQIPLADPRKGGLEKERGPKILVPDSDVSGGASQLGHSQSQSQSEKKSQSQSQSDSARGQPLLPSQVQNIEVPDSPMRMTGHAESNAGRRGPEHLNNRATGASRSQNDSHPPASACSKENVPGREQGKAAARSQSTSQTQTDSQQSADDPFLFSQGRKTPDKRVQNTNNVSINGQPIPSLSKDSQEDQDEERALEEVIDGQRAEEAQAEMNEMDVDDARTHALLSSSTRRRLDRDTKPAEADMSSPTSKDKQFIIKGRMGSANSHSKSGIRGEGQEQSTSKLSSTSPASSPPQSSPSAHLGKRPRSSSISIQSIHQSSSPVLDLAHKENAISASRITKSPRKKARHDSSEGDYVVQRVVHEPHAWQEASFLKVRGQRQKEGQGQSRSENTIETKFPSAMRKLSSDARESRPGSLGRMLANPVDPSIHSASGRKGALTEHTVKNRSPTSSSTPYPNPTLHTNLERKSSRQSASDSRPGTSSSRIGDNSSRAATKKPSWTQMHAQEASSDRLPRSKEETSSTASLWRPDFTLWRDAGGPKWINWADMQGILLKVGRLRHKEALMRDNE